MAAHYSANMGGSPEQPGSGNRAGFGMAYSIAMDRLRTIGVVLALIVLTGCAPAGQPDTTTTRPPTTTTTTTVVLSTPSSDEPALAELAATGDEFPPGVYTRSDFDPPIRLAVDGSWEAVQLADGFFDIQKMAGTPDVIAVQFANVMGVAGATDFVEPDTPAGAVDILNENRSLTVLETSSSRLGGLTGSQVTIENQSDGHAGVLELRQGSLGIDPGRRLWIAFFETDHGLLPSWSGDQLRNGTWL